jgi:TRAP-type C4-dicarboxylate transport system permease small subunit
MSTKLARLFAGASLLGGILLLAATFVTGADVASRWLLGKPIYFAIEFTALSIGLGVLLGFPARFLDKTNVSAQLISAVLSQRAGRTVSRISAIISALLIAYVGYVVFFQAIEKLGLSERTPDMGLSTGPLWVIIAVVMILSAVGAVVAALLMLKEDNAA